MANKKALDERENLVEFRVRSFRIMLMLSRRYARKS